METAHRVVMEATGQWPKTKPPTQEPDDEGEERPPTKSWREIADRINREVGAHEGRRFD